MWINEIVWEQNDVSGRCTVEYKAVKGQVTRTKILETCKTAEKGFTMHSQVCQTSSQWENMSITIRHILIVPLCARCWEWAGSPVLLQCSRSKTVSSARLWLKKHTHWVLTPADLSPLKSCPGECLDKIWARFGYRSAWNSPFLLRQSLTLVGTEAGPLEAAGKDVNGVVKSVDAKLAAVGIVAEKVKSNCKGCPSVSAFSL